MSDIPYEVYLKMKAEEKRVNFVAHFSRFELCVLAAWARRQAHESPNYHPPKADRIRKRWPELIDRAFKLLEEDR